ncbi:hypothetical protein H5203_18815 [Pseudoalteromonas sp. SG41-1]|uniref:hypothetical protein n=1 Tax=Pseudoalteromonas sp. SG41-1 TaxID=2760979 RepID=UPI001603926F|nr:hypothetical protein [Pseudoalteromonas sp. SG41-1]MBB1507521.1 hypothetical protein [Pseudoalteromonas sp. SG41-1]
MTNYNVLELFNKALDFDDTEAAIELFIVLSNKHCLYSPFPRLCNYYKDTKSPVVFSIVDKLIDIVPDLIKEQMFRLKNGETFLAFANQYVRFDLKEVDQDGNTLIHNICKFKHLEEVYVFLTCFPEYIDLLNIQNNKGYTPVMEAMTDIGQGFSKCVVDYAKVLLAFTEVELSKEIKDRFSIDTINQIVECKLFEFFEEDIHTHDLRKSFYKTYSPFIILLSKILDTSPFIIKQKIDKELINFI